MSFFCHIVWSEVYMDIVMTQLDTKGQYTNWIYHSNTHQISFNIV